MKETKKRKKLKSSTKISMKSLGAPTISSSKLRVKRARSLKETRLLRIRIRGLSTLRRRLRSLRSSSLCLITKSRSLKEISVLVR